MDLTTTRNIEGRGGRGGSILKNVNRILPQLCRRSEGTAGANADGIAMKIVGQGEYGTLLLSSIAILMSIGGTTAHSVARAQESARTVADGVSTDAPAIRGQPSTMASAADVIARISG